MLVKIEMLSRVTWTFRSESGMEFFTTCREAIESLMARGVKRAQIVIDYGVAQKSARPRALAERFVSVYGEDGRRFMPHGELIGEEYPPPTGELERRKLRKRQLVCPHCGMAVRTWSVAYK